MQSSGSAKYSLSLNVQGCSWKAENDIVQLNMNKDGLAAKTMLSGKDETVNVLEVRNNIVERWGGQSDCLCGGDGCGGDLEAEEERWTFEGLRAPEYGRGPCRRCGRRSSRWRVCLMGCRGAVIAVITNASQKLDKSAAFAVKAINLLTKS